VLPVNTVFLRFSWRVGVSANTALRKAMREKTDLPVRYPPLNLCTDNGAMIAAAAYYRMAGGAEYGPGVRPHPDVAPVDGHVWGGVELWGCF
jgi:tRNA A37 threonylcarbamoyltransferase TsaD